MRDVYCLGSSLFLLGLVAVKMKYKIRFPEKSLIKFIIKLEASGSGRNTDTGTGKQKSSSG